MRSTALALCVTITTVGLLAAACSSDDGGGGATGGSAGAAGGGAAGGGAGGASGSAGSGGTSGAGGAPSDGNDTKDTAEAITIGTPVQAQLNPPDLDEDWYKFNGTAGQAIYVITQAKTGQDPFDPAYLDLVIELHDATGKIAEQDDPEPRTSNDPFLMTVLPTTGEYFVRVLECNKWAGPESCAPASGITNKDYALVVDNIDFTAVGTVQETEPNETAAQATPITYSPNTSAGAGIYYLSVLHGTFSSETDVDAYSFTLPADLSVDADSRAVARVYPQQAGVDGNGSTTSVGEATIVAESDPTNVIAKALIDAGGSLDVPLQIGTSYVVFFKRAPLPTGNNDFYFGLYGMGSGNPLETQEAANNTLATAEPLTASAQAGSYFIEGDLDAGDVDHFLAGVPGTAAEVVSVACGGERSGSGLRGLTATLLDSSGTAVPSGTGIESATQDLLIDSVSVPAGATSLILKLEATSQDPNVSSSYYRCGLHFRAKTN
jgi:hypothetical protein